MHMNKKLKSTMLAALIGAAGMSTAHAGLLTYQGVTFSSSWSGQVLTLEIDAAQHTGDWARAKGLAALELDGIGDYTSVSVRSAPGGAASWTTSSSELNAQGCSGSTKGQAGSRLCFTGQQIELSDNMVFSFNFSGKAVSTVDPHVKVEFVTAKGRKVGSLLSQTLPASPAAPAAVPPAPSTAPVTPLTPMTPVTPVTPVTPAAPVAAAEPAVTVPANEPVIAPAIEPVPSAGTGAGSNAAASTNGPVFEIPVQELLLSAELPPIVPAAGTSVLLPAAADTANQTELPEPRSIALLLAGLGLMGLTARRKPRA